MNVDRRGEGTVEGQLRFVPPRKLCTDKERVGVSGGKRKMYVTRVDWVETAKEYVPPPEVESHPRSMSRGNGVRPGRYSILSRLKPELLS